MSEHNSYAIRSSESNVNGISCTDRWVGSYVLLLHAPVPLRLRVGRYNCGSPVDLASGHFVYVGSAMGRGEGLYLPKRVLRHSGRTDGQPPHACRKALLSHFIEAGLPMHRLLTDSPKRLRWNIDYVLDQAAVTLMSVFYLRSERRLERDISRMLVSRPDTDAPLPGLGAHDDPGHDHFMRLADGIASWLEACNELESMVAKSE